MPAGSSPGTLMGVDVGGTFTDLVAYDSKSRKLSVLKFPTSADVPSSIAKGIADLGVSPSSVVLFSHATTMSTNALLTRDGLGRTALITNEGFRDVLEIGRQRRPEVYDLGTRRPPPLIERRDRFAVRCRMSAQGKELEPVDPNEVGRVLSSLEERGFDSIAVCFLNSYANPAHEREVLRLLRSGGLEGHISISSEVDNEYREYERTSTTVVNAVLSPLMTTYLSSLSRALAASGVKSPLFVMNSDGGSSTMSHASSLPVHSIESGPAAGVVASKQLAAQLRIEDVLTFDMGGTTAKAGCLQGGEPELTREFEAAGRTHSGRSIRGSGYAVRGSFIDLAEVSAGGGSIASVDEAGGLRVGPRSAGSNPGPACYSRGGVEPTVTDANVVLGRLSQTSLLGGSMPISLPLASRAIRRARSGLQETTIQTASGIVRLANDSMARAISIVSVERGRDPRAFTLFAFGGAGPLHACDLSEELGIRRVVVPVHAGLFSAYGLLAGDLERTFTAPAMSGTRDLGPRFRKLESEAENQMRPDGLRRYTTRRFFEARYRGQSHELTLPYTSSTDAKRAFSSAHRRLYGYSSRDDVEVVNIIVKVRVPGPPKMPPAPEDAVPPGKPAMRRAWVGGRPLDVDVYVRKALSPGARGDGPSAIEEYDSTLFVNPGWRWRVKENCTVLER